jgi:hypothetical protein
VGDGTSCGLGHRVKRESFQRASLPWWAANVARLHHAGATDLQVLKSTGGATFEFIGWKSCVVMVGCFCCSLSLTTRQDSVDVRIYSPYGASGYEAALSIAEYHLHTHALCLVFGDGVKIKHLPPYLGRQSDSETISIVDQIVTRPGENARFRLGRHHVNHQG